MEEMSNSGGLEEISAVAPILQKIADDPAVIKVVRARAQAPAASSRDQRQVTGGKRIYVIFRQQNSPNRVLIMQEGPFPGVFHVQTEH